VLVIMGVAGSGKSTLAAELSRRLRCDFAEGDALHSPANVAKMAAGKPLTDADRVPWLVSVEAWVAEHTASRRPGVITCSALKRRYRDVLRDEHVRFVFLDVPREELQRRLTGRPGHFMPPALLDSQLADLEVPGSDENAIRLDGTAPVNDQAQKVIDALG
jgi:gluconokinase